MRSDEAWHCVGCGGTAYFEGNDICAICREEYEHYQYEKQREEEAQEKEQEEYSEVR